VLAFPSRTDIDLVALDTYFVTADTIPSSIGALAIPDIEREVMPGARDNEPLHSAFIQRTALVRTEVMYGIDLPLDVEQGDGTVVERDNFGSARRQVFDLRD
jgi:hypothetical protein